MKDDPSPLPAPAGSIERLKQLLFDSENATLLRVADDLAATRGEVATTRADLGTTKAHIERTRLELETALRQLSATSDRLSATTQQLGETRRDVAATHSALEAISAYTAELAAMQQKAHAELTSTIAPVASPERLRTSIAEVLDGAIREAEEKRHDPMARAVAPLVVKTVKSELRNSQDEMVQALYPLTGRMVKSYVQSAIKDLMAQINRRLDQNPVMLRLKSVTSGKSMAELALADTQRLRVEEVFLVRRGSGELIERWPLGVENANSDVHLSAVLTAINDFSAEMLGDGGEIRAFQVGDATMLLRASPLFLLTARCNGIAPAGIDSALDEAFLSAIDRIAKLDHSALSVGAAANSVLAPFSGDLTSRIDDVYETTAQAGGGPSPIKLIGYALGLLLLGWVGWWSFTYVTTEHVRSVAESTRAESAELNGYPIAFTVAPRGGRVDVAGLTPSIAARQAFEANLRTALPRSVVNVDRLGVVPGPGSDPTPELQQLRDQVAGIEGAVQRGTMKRNLDRAARRLAVVEREIAKAADAGAGGPKQAQLRRIASDVRTAGGAVQSVLGAMDGATAAGGSAAGVARRDPAPALIAVIERLKAATAELENLIADGGATSGAGRQPAASAGGGGAVPARLPPDQLSEELALVTERLDALAIAVAQLSSLPIPERVIEKVVTVQPAPAATPQPSARERLAAYARSHAIFFANGTELRAPDAARGVLDEIAGLMRESDAVLRVVGYTDVSGGTDRNTTISQARAELVVDGLVQRAIPRDRLIAIGRPNGPDIGVAKGPTSPNRRVEFEIGFPGETEKPQ